MKLAAPPHIVSNLRALPAHERLYAVKRLLRLGDRELAAQLVLAFDHEARSVWLGSSEPNESATDLLDVGDVRRAFLQDATGPQALPLAVLEARGREATLTNVATLICASVLHRGGGAEQARIELERLPTVEQARGLVALARLSYEETTFNAALEAVRRSPRYRDGLIADLAELAPGHRIQDVLAVATQPEEILSTLPRLDPEHRHTALARLRTRLGDNLDPDVMHANELLTLHEVAATPEQAVRYARARLAGEIAVWSELTRDRQIFIELLDQLPESTYRLGLAASFLGLLSADRRAETVRLLRSLPSDALLGVLERCGDDLPEDVATSLAGDIQISLEARSCMLSNPRLSAFKRSVLLVEIAGSPMGSRALVFALKRIARRAIAAEEEQHIQLMDIVQRLANKPEWRQAIEALLPRSRGELTVSLARELIACLQISDNEGTWQETYFLSYVIPRIQPALTEVRFFDAGADRSVAGYAAIFLPKSEAKYLLELARVLDPLNPLDKIELLCAWAAGTRDAQAKEDLCERAIRLAEGTAGTARALAYASVARAASEGRWGRPSADAGLRALAGTDIFVKAQALPALIRAIPLEARGPILKRELRSLEPAEGFPGAALARSQVKLGLALGYPPERRAGAVAAALQEARQLPPLVFSLVFPWSMPFAEGKLRMQLATDAVRGMDSLASTVHRVLVVASCGRYLGDEARPAVMAILAKASEHNPCRHCRAQYRAVLMPFLEETPADSWAAAAFGVDDPYARRALFETWSARVGTELIGRCVGEFLDALSGQPLRVGISGLIGFAPALAAALAPDTLIAAAEILTEGRF